MRVDELRELLEEMDDDMEVRFAGQPNWPFEYSINGAFVSLSPNKDGIIYLAEGRQLGYLPDNVVEGLCW